MTVEELPEKPPASTRKADFGSIYNQPDPRAYFSALKPLEYQVPQHALPFVGRVLEISGASSESGRRRKVLDVCCSYGINAALLRYDVDLEGLTEYYTSGPSSEGQMERDRAFFASKLRRPGIEVCGLDVAPQAIEYALSAGLMASGWAEDLERSDPLPEMAAGLRDVEVVVCTGGVGYVGPRTFERVVSCAANPRALWLVTFVLRVYEFDEIAEMLKRRWGLVTEKVEGRVFRQRRFVSREEGRGAVEGVERRGMDAGGLEEGGWFYAECFVTRPGSWRGCLGW